MSSLLPAYLGHVGGGWRPLERLSTCVPAASKESRAPHLTAVLGPPAAACDAAVPCRPVAPR